MQKRMLPVMVAAMMSVPVANAEETATVKVSPLSDQTATQGPEAYFTGSARIDSRFSTTEPARVRGGTVTFEPGARTAWHTHPLGQTLIVTSGIGLVSAEDGPVQEIREGDSVWIPPNVKHWHGAAPDHAMTHIAISEVLDGESVVWLDKVTDEEYQP